MQQRSERAGETTSSATTDDQTAISGKRIQLLKERLELYNATIAEALGAATAFTSARKEHATQFVAAPNAQASHNVGRDSGSISNSSNGSDSPSLTTSSQHEDAHRESNGNNGSSNAAAIKVSRPNVEINVTRLRPSEPQSMASAGITTNTTATAGGHSIRRGIGTGLRVPPSRPTQLERNLNSEFVAATNIADTGPRPRPGDTHRSPAPLADDGCAATFASSTAPSLVRDARNDTETVAQAAAWREAQRHTRAADDVDGTAEGAPTTKTSDSTETGGNGDAATESCGGAANSRQSNQSEALPSSVDVSPGVALEARTRALLQRAAELYRTHQRSQTRGQSSPNVATAPTPMADAEHDVSHHGRPDNNNGITTDTSITSLASSTAATSTTTSITTTATTTPTTSRETSHSFTSSTSSGLSSLLHQAAALAPPHTPTDPANGRAGSCKEGATPTQDTGKDGTALQQQARRDAMDALEVAYNQLSLTQRRTAEVNEVMGVDAFPRALPHHDTVEQVRARRIALTAAEAELSLHPPDGPTLQAIFDTDGTRLQEAVTHLLTGCSAALACLTIVEDRRARLKERQRLARQRQEELTERQQARQLVETEVAQARARLVTRRRDLQTREEAYLRMFNEHDAASERTQSDINEVEQLGKTVAAWLKILEEREEHLAEKEEKLHRVQVDLARRSEDLQLYNAALGARSKQPQRPSRVSL